ncbi:DUF4386 domain-containing protein [Roseovarius faecimaris]|uniref:DUF4386 domain-containing protein n=1 Tax=Roseovarius faecimaris TaxID=2494550 RepID=A0A6I6IT70_9RHOB|nr:DUF4386 domain-containing protein [Roseovarius faecimaris]QGX98991.1 DUF4386 domain-containing protein [Roseovarius faecimaris]
MAAPDPHIHAPADHRRIARVAGVLYLVIIICGVWSEGFARASLITPGDAAATLAGLKTGLALFRLSLVADTLMALADVTLAVVFLYLLAPVGSLLALLATALRLVQAATITVGLVLLTGIFALVERGDANAVLGLTGMHANAYDIGLIFFGANSLVMAILLRRAGGVPTALCWAIAASGLVYLTGSYLRLLVPPLHAGFQIAYLLPLLAETALCLWLLIVGRVYPAASR